MKLEFNCWIHICIPKHLEQSWNKQEAVLHWGVSSVFCNILKSTQKYTQNKHFNLRERFLIHFCCICFHLKYLEIISNVPSNKPWISFSEGRKSCVHIFRTVLRSHMLFRQTETHYYFKYMWDIQFMSACWLKILALGSTEQFRDDL